MNILALDCATKVGWATLINGRIDSGVQDFSKRRGESNGMMFLRFRKWLYNDMRSEFDVVAYEQPLHRGGAATEICVNFAGRAQEFAASIGAETIAPFPSTIKKAITGSGRASKEDMMAWFKKQTGREPIDENEADAFAILRFTMNELGQTTRGDNNG
jgi:Holliday junction resolvasome RuvABC endonuclease subunit